MVEFSVKEKKYLFSSQNIEKIKKLGKRDKTGKKNPMYGKHHSKKAKEKMSKAKENYVPWNKGKIGVYSKDVIKKISETKKRQYKEGKIKHWNLGRHWSEKVKEKIRQKRKKQRFPKNKTKPELKLVKIIQKYNLPFKYTGDGSFWIENINPDFIEVNGKKIAIDVFGDYWHNPKLRKNIKQNYTEEGRKKVLNKYGWNLLIIWENELKGDENLIVNKINNFMVV